MPIRPENNARYPNDWKRIAEAIRERAGNLCSMVPTNQSVGRAENCMGDDRLRETVDCSRCGKQNVTTFHRCFITGIGRPLRPAHLREAGRVSTVLAKRVRQWLPDQFAPTDRPVRLYPGHWQRSEGAWSWQMRSSLNAVVLIGSPAPMADCAKRGTGTEVSAFDPVALEVSGV